MKKKHRDIIVNGLPYAWTYQQSEQGGELKIWKNKKVIYKSQVESTVSVTPAYVAELITATEDFGDVSSK